MRLATGAARLRSEITQESAEVDFAVLHLGDHNITAGVRPKSTSTNGDFHTKLLQAFSQADTAEAIRLLDQAFDKNTFSLRLLFRDEQRKIANTILTDSLTSAAAVYRTFFESQAPLIRFLNGLSIPVPRALMSAAEIAINYQLQQSFERPDLDSDSILGLLKEAAAGNVPLDTTTLEYAIPPSSRYSRKTDGAATTIQRCSSILRISFILRHSCRSARPSSNFSLNYAAHTHAQRHLSNSVQQGFPLLRCVQDSRLPE